jgi:Ca-activated chloride channel family protein
MTKDGFDELDLLRASHVPAADPAARERALAAAMRSFDEAGEKNATAPQGSVEGQRLTARATRLWREIMQRKLVATPAIAGLVALPIAGYASWQLIETMNFGVPDISGPVETSAPAARAQDAEIAAEQPAQAELRERGESEVAAAPPPAAEPDTAIRGIEMRPATRDLSPGAVSKLSAPSPATEAYPAWEETNRDRIQAFDGNPIRAALEHPVSTFSIDVDTASYSFVRGTLKGGFMPQADTVRVEEMINYFPYDWAGPESADVPFNTTVTVTPSPWNDHTQLMHIGIKGYEIETTERPRANLVFLIDTSGSMNTADKLPLLKNSFRLLVDRLGADDTVSIVTYAGNAGTVLEPTPASDKGAILDALDRLEAGGRTAGEAGLNEAYRLAERSFVDGGVNRVILATDGDFNVGLSGDDELKRVVEEKRQGGVFLSVLGFGRGNLNDQLMQTLAQNGNGTASYIDTLAEAEKVLVEEASSTLFTIASDVKIQVEFNPERIAEYRLIGYETRALNREDFNNDRVDAGDIGSGHTVTAIYEITPRGSPAQMIDELRYGSEPQAAGPADELAFVKLRYKAPGEETSRLISTPVTDANAVASFDAADEDVRFSIAVAAFGQKLRGADQLAGTGYERIMEIATAARGTDPFGYRAEFLSLVRLASALDGKR